MDQSDRLAKEIIRRYDAIHREIRKSNLQRKSFGQDLRGAFRNRSFGAYADSSSAVASAAMAMLAPGLASMAGGAIDEAVRSRQSKVREIGQNLEKEFVDRMSRNEAISRISKEYGISRRDISRALRGQGGRVGSPNARRMPSVIRTMPSPMTRGPVVGGYGTRRTNQEIRFNRELINRRVKLENEARKRQERKVPSFFGSLKKTVGGKVRGALPDLASGLAGGVLGMFAPGLAGPIADMLGEALSAKMERRSEVRREQEREQEGQSRMAGVRKQLEGEYGSSRYGRKALKQLYSGQDSREKFPILDRMKAGKVPFRRRRSKGDGMSASVRAFRDTSEATSNATEPKAIIELMKMGRRDSESLSAKVMRKVSATSSLGLNAFRDSSEGMHQTVSSTKQFIEVATEDVTRLTTATIKEIKKLVRKAINSMGGEDGLLDDVTDLLPGGRKGGRGGTRTGGGLSGRFLKKRATTTGRAGIRTRAGVRRLASPSRWKWLSKAAPGISGRLRLNRMGRIGGMGKVGRFGGGGLGLAGGLAAAYGLSHLLPGYSTGSAAADELQGKFGMAQMGSGALSMLGRGGTGVLGKVGRIAGKAALPLQAAMSALDFYGGYVNPEEALGRKKKDELERVSGGGAKMLSGLTMGMIGSKHFGRGGEIIGGKMTRGVESVVGKGNLYRLANAATFGAFGKVNEAGTKAKGGIMGKGNYDAATMTKLFGKNWNKDLEKMSSTDPVKFKAMMDRYNAAMNKSSESMEKTFGDKGKVTKTMTEFSDSAGGASDSLKKMDENIAAVVKEVSPVVSAAPAAASAPVQQRASDRTPDAASKKKPGKRRKAGGVPAIREDMTEVEKLGTLSRFVESRGGEGSATVSTGQGDAGGASYGLYQMTSKTTDKKGRSKVGGTVSGFIGGSKWAKEFEGLTPGSPEYTKKWKEIATGPQAKEFEAAQHQYIKQTHYDPAMQKLQKAGIDLSGRGMAVKNVMWQASVGAGAKGGSNIVRNALKGKDMAGMSDKDVINAIYDEMGKPGEGGQGLAYYGKNRADVQEGVKRNLERAREAALAMEAGAGGKGQPGQPVDRPTTRLDQDVRMADTRKGMEQSAEIEGAKIANMKPIPIPAGHQGNRTGGPDNVNKYHGVNDPDLAALNSNWPMFDSV